MEMIDVSGPSWTDPPWYFIYLRLESEWLQSHAEISESRKKLIEKQAKKLAEESK